MSTKLYHGFILAEGTDLFAFVDRVRGAAQPVRDRLDAEMLAGRAATTVDKTRSGLTPAPAEGATARLSPLALAATEFVVEQTELKAKGRTDQVFYDPHSLSVGFARDPRTGRILGYPFADRNDLRDAVLELDGVSEYGYWDNSDRPDNLTETQWRERREAWERVAPDYRPLSTVMLTFQLQPDRWFDFDLTRRTDGGLHPLIRRALPSPEARGSDVLTDLLFRRSQPCDANEGWAVFLESKKAARPYAARAGEILGDLTDAHLLEPTSTLTQDPDVARALDELADTAAAAGAAS